MRIEGVGLGGLGKMGKKKREKWRKIGTFLGKMEKKWEKERRILTAESAKTAEIF